MLSEQSEINRLQQANALGLEYLRTVVLLIGGAILALLTFMGNASQDAAIQFSIEAVKGSMIAFLVGIVAVLVALIVSYTYTATAPSEGYHKFWDGWIIPLNAVLAVVSLAAFVCGVIQLVVGAGAA